MHKQLLFACFLFPTFLFSQIYDSTYFNAFPKYEEILKTYWNTTEQEPYYFRFAKKKGGWYLQELDKKTRSNTINETQLWKATTQQYAFDTTSTKANSADKLIDYFLRQFEANQYDIAPIFGYEGDHLDLIDLLGNEANLSADLLNILARSYSKHCNKMMQRLNTTQKPFETYFKTFDKKDLSPISIDEYIKYANLAIEKFQLLYYKYPEYHTMVGNIQLKHWNEYLSHFLNLMILQQPEAAKAFLKDNIYDDYSINFAKNILSTCAENAILFTYGDTDTYSLLYAQHHLDFRKDVTVVNINLCNTTDYINYIKHLLPENQLIQMTLPITQYTNKANQYFIVKKGEDAVDANAFLKKLINSELETTDENATGKIFPSQQIEFQNTAKENIQHQFGEAYLFDKKMSWTFSYNYLLKNHLAILDIITTNQWKRSIYFTIGTTTTARLFLDNYIELEGLAYRLTPLKKGTKRIAKATLQNNLNKKYNWSIPPIEYRKIGQFSATYSQYLNLYIQLLGKTIDKAEKKAILNQMQQHLPIAQLNYEMYSYPIANGYYQINDATTGDKVLLKGGQALVSLLEQNPNDNYTKRSARAFIQLAKNNKRIQLYDTLNKMLSTYLKE